MNNNPFEVDDKKYKRNPFEADKSKKKSSFLVSLIIVAAVFIIIYNVNAFLNSNTTAFAFATQKPLLTIGEDDESTMNNQTEDPEGIMTFENLARSGESASLTTKNSHECILYAEGCNRYVSGSEFEPGLYTITMNYTTDDYYDALIRFEFDLSDYFGITHDTLSDYFEFDLDGRHSITIQNIPLQPGSVITAFNQLGKDKVNFELTPQENTIAFDFNNPIPGLYIANQDIDLGSYKVAIDNQKATQTNSLEYIPTVYEGEDYSFLYNDGDELIIDENSAIMYYDTATTIKQV